MITPLLRTVQEIYSLDNQMVKFSIPKYQRSYVWTVKNWENLFDEINNIYDEERNVLFLGSIICVNSNTNDPYKENDLEIIDGQQRIITISILLLAIYNRLIEIFNEDLEKRTEYYFSIGSRIFDKSTKKTRISPSSEKMNDKDYAYLFEESFFPNQNFEKPNYYTKRLIYKCYQYFENKLKNFKLSQIEAFWKKLGESKIVLTIVSNHDLAFYLFETLNNTGVRLNATDIIKSKLLSKFTDEKELNEAYDKWTKMSKNLEEDDKNLERFFRHFYNVSIRNNTLNTNTDRKATTTKLVSIYENLISVDHKKLIDDLVKSSSFYRKLITPSEVDNFEKKSALRLLENVNGVDGYMLLFFISNYSAAPTSCKWI